MLFHFPAIHIRGIAAALPRQELNLRDLEGRFGGEEVARIMATTGIQAVRVAPPEMCASDLCEAAARRLLAETDLAPADLDALVFVSQTPDYPLPATAACLQERLGLPKSAAVFDLNCGCTGFIYGLLQACLLTNAGAKRVLVLAGDTSTRLVNLGDKSVRMIFGDAGSAAIIEPGPDAAVIAVKTDGSGARHLIIPAGGARRPVDAGTAEETVDDSGNRRSARDLFMDGMEVMNFTLREVPPVIEETLARAGWPRESVGAYVLHQANRFILDYLRKKMKLPTEVWPVTMERTGNTGPASIPLALAVDRERLQREGRLARCLLCGFGVGLSWGAAAVDLSRTTILDPVDV